MRAMVLAAGLGTRLRPLTNDRPKALVELSGRTMLEITLARLREFGIRLALGAQPRDVLLMVLRSSALIMAAGLVVGLLAAFALARFVTAFLYGVNTNSPVAFLLMALLLAAVGVFASFIPARRASKVDPMVALHYE